MNFLKPVHESDKVRSTSTFQKSLFRFSCNTSRFVCPGHVSMCSRNVFPRAFDVLVTLNQQTSGNGASPCAFRGFTKTTVSSVVSPWSDSTSKDPTSTMHIGTFCNVSCPFFSQFRRGPPLMRVLALQSVLMWPKRSQREHSLSVLLFHPPLALPLLKSCRGLVTTLLRFLVPKRYNSPSLLSMNSSLLAS